MHNDSVLERHFDGKRFMVTRLAHFADLESDDGETDCVKHFSGADFIGCSSGHLYTVVEEHATRRPSFSSTFNTLIPPPPSRSEPFECVCTDDDPCDYHRALRGVG